MEVTLKEEPTIQRTKISIITKKKERQKRPPASDQKAPSKRANLLVDADSLSLTDVTLIHPADGLIKDERILLNTLNTNVTLGPNFTCHFCGNSFFSGLKLKMHFLMEHRVLFCKVCDVLVESPEEKSEHDERVHNGRTCEICQRAVVGGMEEHYKEHDALICRYCDVLLQPSGHYGKHLMEKHCVTENFVKSNRLEEIVDKTGKGCAFFCKLCEKDRYRELFGHFSYYHKVNTYYLAEVFTRQSIDLKLNNISEAEEIKNKVGPQKGSRYTCCKICLGVYTKNIPKKFHKVYCEGKVNDKFTCERCDLNLSNLTELDSHYKVEHRIVSCQLCDEFLPESTNHLTEVHKVSKIGFVRLTEAKLGEIICTLCDKILTSLMESTRDIFAHFKNEHAMSLAKILRLIGTRPTIKRVESTSDTESESDEYIPDTTRDNFKSDFDPKFVKCHFNLANIKRTPGETSCEFCHVLCSSNLGLICHLHDKHGFKVMEKILECTNCSLTDRNFQLETHIEHYEAVKDEIFNCGKCRFAMSLEDARGHILERHSDTLAQFSLEDCGAKCRFCSKSYWRNDDLEKHELSEHFSDNKKEFFECYNCTNNFCSIESLLEHKSEIKTDCDAYTDITYQCLVCHVVFPSVPHVRMHFQEAHPKLTIVFCADEECKKTFALKKYAKLHYKNLHEKKEGLPTNYECEICGRTFTNKKSYLLHTKNSHAKGFKCVICGDKFQTAEHRKHHYTTVHPGELFYECTECQKTFLSKSGLHVHSKLHNEFSSVCSYCGKEFFRRDSYKEHLLIHIGPKHQCTYCPKVFTQKSNLRRHIRLHTGEKPYNCPYCSKKFSDKGACNSHITVHTREEECYCEVCGKKFSKQQKLRYHMKRHTGEGLAKCDICHRGFTSQYDLRKHLLTHDQQTQIICECGRGFSSEKYLRTHIKVVHDPNRPKQALKKKKTKFNCFQCLVCKNIYSLRTTILKHLRNIHKLDRKQYYAHMRRLDPEEEALFTPTVLEEQVGPSGRLELHATIKKESDDEESPEYTNERDDEIRGELETGGKEELKTRGEEEIRGELETSGKEERITRGEAELGVTINTDRSVGASKGEHVQVARARNRKHKNPSRYCGGESSDESGY